VKTVLRALILLLIVLWLGGVLYFPVIAGTAFTALTDTHAAGTIVAQCLRFLHYEGLICGALIVLLLLMAQWIKAVPRSVIAPVAVTIIMLALTAYSQFSIIPRMESDRLAAGGAIDAVPPNNPHRVAFNKLHNQSETVEEGVMLAGVLLVILVAANYPSAARLS
jgi:MFS superfamily sulfate permease-like transporter